jgi:hypothetical protein
LAKKSSLLPKLKVGFKLVLQMIESAGKNSHGIHWDGIHVFGTYVYIPPTT